MLLIQRKGRTASSGRISTVSCIQKSITPDIVVKIFQHTCRSFVLFFSDTQICDRGQFFSICNKCNGCYICFSDLIHFLLCQLRRIESVGAFCSRQCQLFAFCRILYNKRYLTGIGNTCL